MSGARWATAGAAVLILAGAASAQGRASFGAGDDGRNVRLFAPEFTVDLPTNAGAGYHWEFGNTYSRHVQLVGRGPGSAPPHAPGIVGFPVATRFTLRTTGPSGEVRFGLFPPGPTAGAPERVWWMSFHSAYAGPPPRAGARLLTPQ